MKNIKALGAAGLVFLMVTSAPVWAAGNDGGPRATASASKVSKQLKSLKKRIAALESKADAPAAPVPSSPAGGAPSGPAGGALTGAYPNPGLASNSVDSAAIASEAVNGAEIATNAVDGPEVEDGSLNASDVGHASGSTLVDPPQLASGDCIEVEVNTGTGVQMNDDPIAVTMAADWPSTISVTPENSPTAGRFRLGLCNNGGTQNPAPVAAHWVAFDG